VIFSVRYRTGKGIGVGSPLRALRRLHDVELTGRETFRLHDSGLEVLISNGAVATITVA
jgi:hypothetical protein